MPTWYAYHRFFLLFLQSIIGVGIFFYPLKKRKHYKVILFLAIIIGFVICSFMREFVYDSSRRGLMDFQSIFLRIICTVIVYFLVIFSSYAYYQESFYSGLFIASSGYLAQSIAGSFKALIKLFPFADLLANHNFGILLLDLICYGGIYVLLFIVFRPYVCYKEDNFNNKLKAVFSFVVLLLCIGMARITTDNLERGVLPMISENLYSIICSVLVLIMQFGVMQNAELEQNVITMQELIHQQHLQYENSKETAQLLNEKYHDLKQLVRGFRGKVSSSQLDEFEQSVALYDAHVHTGIATLDILLTEKHAFCIQQGIQLTCILGAKIFDFMEELDLYFLFSNALSNAIRAVSELPEKKERFISLNAVRNGDMIMIHMENPCEGNVEFKDNLPVSNQDPRYHGFGMRSMERIALKYNGSLSANQINQIFYLDIVLFT